MTLLLLGWGIMSSKRIGELISRCRIPPEYMYGIPSDNECISISRPLEVAMCGENFQVKFCLPLYPFVERLLVRYELVATQIHPNDQRIVISFLIKCSKIKLELQMRSSRLFLMLKFGLSSKLIVYANYRNKTLFSLVFDSCISGMVAFSSFSLRLSYRPLVLSRGLV